jgi:DnaJ-class molecular chaperone
MTEEIRELIEKETQYTVCDTCDGVGEIDYFCGHESWTICQACEGTGLILSSNKKDTSGYAAIPWGLRFRESDLGQAINCTKMEEYFHHDNPEMKSYLTDQINYWLDFHRAKHNVEV